MRRLSARVATNATSLQRGLVEKYSLGQNTELTNTCSILYYIALSKRRLHGSSVPTFRAGIRAASSLATCFSSAPPRLVYFYSSADGDSLRCTCVPSVAPHPAHAHSMASCIATRGLHAVFTSRPAYARALSTVTHARITRDSTLRTPIDGRRAWALGSSAGQLGVGVSASDDSFAGLSRGLHTGSYAWCAHYFPVEPLDDFDWETLLSMQQTACEKYSDNPLFGTKTVGTAACVHRTRGRSQIGPLSRQGPGHFEWMTYRDFGQRVDDFRGALSRAGLSAGDKACGGSCWSRCHVSYCSYSVPRFRPQIAIISKNRVEWAIAAFAGYD